MTKLIYVHFFLLAVLFSCKKKVFENNILIPHDGLDYIDCNCPSLTLDVEHQLSDPGLYSVYDATNHLWPQINPNNPDEIAYVFQPYNNYSETRIIIYNMITQEKRVLIDEWVTGSISWGKKDWIVFQANAGLQLYKIKSNGDSLTPIGNGQWFHPSWNATGEKLLVFHKFNNYPYKTYILDIEGNVTDSVASWEWHHIGRGDWSHPDYYLNHEPKKIRIIDLEEKKVVKTISAPSPHKDGLFSWVGWHSHNKLLFSALGGVFTYDLTTDQISHIKCMCGFYTRVISHASDFSKIILGKTEIQLIENNQKYFIDHKLFLLNPLTFEEEEIFIP